jgi:mRNA interferase MazF
MPYRRGDVVYVPFQYTELSGGKVRPAVVISSVEFHNTEQLYIVAALTSNLSASTLGYPLQDIASAGLKVPSLVRPVLLTLSPELIGRRVGQLSTDDLGQLDTMLKRALGLA